MGRYFYKYWDALVNNHKNFKQPMNQLFTFNSSQFQVLQPLPPLRNLRKRIIRTGQGKRALSRKSSPSSSPEKRLSQEQPQRQSKKVSFKEIPSPQPTQSTTRTDPQYGSEEIDSHPSKATQGSSHRYEAVLRKMTSMETQLQKEGEKMAGRKGVHLQGEVGMRRERKVKSVKQAPRVVCPISDKKLPKVFKMAGCQPFLPPIGSANKDRKEELQIRQTFSAQMPRKTMDKENQLKKLRSDMCFVERGAFTPRT